MDVLPLLKKPHEAIVHMKFLQSKRQGQLIENYTKYEINK